MADTSKVSLEKEDIHIPHNLEIIWGAVRPKQESKFKVIIEARFYLPPKSKKRTNMFDHISETLQWLLIKYI